MSAFFFNRAALLSLLSGALLLLAPALPAQAPAAAAPDMTPQEHFNAARLAFEAGDWPQAEQLYDSFIKTYEKLPETADTARKMKPLLVTARLRQKKYAETLPLLIETLKDPLLDPGAADELAFWKGICLLQTEEHEDARLAFGEFYAEKQPYLAKLQEPQRRVHAGRRTESVLLYGMCLLLKPDYPAAATFFAEQTPALRQVNREAAGRATVLRLHALVEAGEDDAGLALVRETYPHMAEITQVVAFHTLSLQLGSKLLEAGRYYDAIVCLQRIWPREQLLATQRAAVAQFTARLDQVKKQPGQEFLAFQYEGLLTRIQREIDAFEKIENFDSALRMRLAMAYKELNRYRETALILEDMLARMPPNPIVQQASLSLIQCWMQVERWPKAVAAADAYVAKFPEKDNKDLPMVQFLKASALHGDQRANEAELEFAAVHQRYPAHELAARALFMEGICLLEQDLNMEAIDAFNDVAKRYAQSEVNEDCFYWAGMALSFEKRHEEARKQMETYLKRYTQNTRYRSEADFRIAFSSFGLAQYPRAIGELRTFIAQHPLSEFVDEARLLLGDALGAEGKTEEAILAYRSISRTSNARFFEEAWFRVGIIYKLSERPDEMRAHYERFIAENPESNRIAEAVYWVGVTHTQAGRQEEARQAYWDAVTAYGDRAEARAVEDIFVAMAKVYPGEEGRADLTVKLDEVVSANRERHPVLALRALWAKALMLRKKDPAASQALLLEALPLVKAKSTSPRIIADCADALRESGKLAEARALYVELRKWHPRAMEKDRAFLGLGLIAVAENQPDEALKSLARFEKETLGSPLVSTVAGIKGDLLVGKRKFDEAKAEYERILEMPYAARQVKAQTLLKLGDLLVKQKQDLKSAAYFERVYVSYGKYLPEVAQAYWKRGQALDRLGMADKALEVYRELGLRTELAALPEAQQAVQLLNKRSPDWRLTPSTTEPAEKPPAAKPTT
jgi:TolA-binding protein